ncbi:hypothetical protein CSUI_001066 [Cystoisospora suis]|uniref:Transmembrane protein n=1 Tax=Cystoisospora suis TaxID=483139 RepID=A0A2C6LD00_9APIC|nr:hypothetical protein CSUI_001066 [Cystoisospora suis]
MKLDEIPDEKKRAIFEEKWLKLYAKRANKDFLAITHRFEQHHLHATEKSSRWIKPLRSLFKEKSLADSLNENDWASELPSESDPTYMSSQTDDVPREMKDIMMGLGDRKGIFKNLLRSSVAQGDEERSRRFFRRFDVKRWRRTGSFFLPLAGIGFFVSKLRSSSLLTSLGLATRYMWMKDKDGEEDDEELGESSSSSSVSQHKRRSTDGRKSVDGKKKKKKLPSLKTILLTGGLLALHAALGVFSVSAFILPAIEDSVGTSFSFITPEGLVASNVILQWWISSNLYRISSVSRKDRNKEDEEEEEEEDEDDDGEDDQDGGEDGRRNGEDGEEDDDLGGGPLADEE